MTQPNPPRYRRRPIGSIAALARALAVDESRLVDTAANASLLYNGPIKVLRPGKKPRDTFAPRGPLLDLQRRILDRILRQVAYPPYLMGGLPDRSFIQNAQRHAGAAVVFGQDVEAFFPSIKLRSALEKQGYRPKREKQFVGTQRHAIGVHGLNVNSSVSVRKNSRNPVLVWSSLMA